MKGSLRARVAVRAGPLSRWGLLLTAVALVAALLGTGISAYLTVQSSTVPLVRQMAREILSAARQSLHVGDAPTPEVMQDALAELSSERVRYVAVTGHDGVPVVSAGTPAASSSWSPPDRGPGPSIQLGPGARVRVTGPLVGPGRGAGWRSRTGAPHAAPSWRGLADPRIVVEFEPVAVQHLSRSADEPTPTLAAGLGAASEAPG